MLYRSAYNPFHGPSIKKLKGDFAGVYCYRIGDFRLFYVIRRERSVVVVIDVRDAKARTADRVGWRWSSAHSTG